VNPEKIYVEVPGELGWREYPLPELMRLWRTAQLPRDARYQDSEGEWHPLAELVVPLIRQEIRAGAVDGTDRAVDGATARRWVRRGVWMGLGAVLVAGALGILLGRPGHERSGEARVVPEEVSLGLGRDARIEELIRSGQVIPGMTPEQVRRSWGEPHEKKATADTAHQQWIYRHQTVIFENGIAVRIETNVR
jgi:hypothetical protein